MNLYSMRLKNNFARIARGPVKGDGTLVVFYRASLAAVPADMHITPRSCGNEAQADKSSIMFITVARVLTVIDSAMDLYAQIPKSGGDLLEATVWAEVCALLENPKRLEDEYRRRLAAPEIDPDLDSVRAQIAKVKQTISRLIDGYAEGLIDKDEFTLRVRRAKDRSAQLEEQLRSQADLAAQRRDLLLIITRLEDFASRIKHGLQHADRDAKRDLVRAVVRRVQIGPDGVNVVFRVDPAIPPSVPPAGIMPDCTRGEIAAECQAVVIPSA